MGAIPPPPIQSVSPLESMRSGGGIPPPLQKGYLSDSCAIPFEKRQNTPLGPKILHAPNLLFVNYLGPKRVMKTFFNTPPYMPDSFGEFFSGRVMGLGVMSLGFVFIGKAYKHMETLAVVNP